MESNISPYMDEINRQMLSVVSPRKGEDRKKERRGEQREREFV